MGTIPVLQILHAIWLSAWEISENSTIRNKYTQHIPIWPSANLKAIKTNYVSFLQLNIKGTGFHRKCVCDRFQLQWIPFKFRACCCSRSKCTNDEWICFIIVVYIQKCLTVFFPFRAQLNGSIAYFLTKLRQQNISNKVIKQCYGLFVWRPWFHALVLLKASHINKQYEPQNVDSVRYIEMTKVIHSNIMVYGWRWR